jgi:hypothetical protein
MSENETTPEKKIEKPRQIKTKFEWNELNRVVEIMQSFDAVAANFLRHVDPSLVDEMRFVLVAKLYEVLTRKFQLTIASINLETAINIIDEQLPKILKNSNLDVDEMLKAWGIVKNLFSQKKDLSQKKGEKK